MRRFLPTSAALLLSLGCLETATPDRSVDDVCAAATEACTADVDAAIGDVRATQASIGIADGWRGGTFRGVVTAVEDDALTFATDTGEVVFRWPGALPAGFSVGDEGELLVRGGWQVLKTSRLGIGAWSDFGYRPVESAREIPGGGPTLALEAACSLEEAFALAVHADWFGEKARILPGEEAALGEWTLRNHGGWYEVPAGGSGDGDAIPGGGGEPPRSEDVGSCAGLRRPMAPPTLYRIAATGVWRPTPGIEWCSADVLRAIDTEPARPLGEHGIAFSGGRRLDEASGTVDRIAWDTVEVAIDGGGRATFVWPGQLPGGLAAGDAVELSTVDGWHVLDGPIRLAILAWADFTFSSPPPPLFGTLSLPWTEVCHFPDGDAATTCGQPRGTATLYGILLPDGSVLPPGGEARVGATVIGLPHALQLPSYGDGACVVDAWAEGLISAWAPGSGAE